MGHVVRLLHLERSNACILFVDPGFSDTLDKGQSIGQKAGNRSWPAARQSTAGSCYCCEMHVFEQGSASVVRHVTVLTTAGDGGWLLWHVSPLPGPLESSLQWGAPERRRRNNTPGGTDIPDSVGRLCLSIPTFGEEAQNLTQLLFTCCRTGRIIPSSRARTEV